MRETKTVVRLWWAWSPERIENWLEDMESQGWRLYNTCCGMVVFRFVKDKPKSSRYCFDYQNEIRPEYKAIFEDAGWELMHSGGGWYLWRMEYQQERPEIYTDSDSLIQRNNRLIGLLTAVFAAQMPFIAINISNIKHISPFIVPLMAVYFVIIIVLAYAMSKLYRYNKSLKRREK